MDCYLTVKDLKEKIKDLPDETPVYYQRIEDVYFEKHGWDKSALSLLWEEFGDEKIFNDYIRAFSCYKHPDKEVFVINAHY
jgi:hypothetical protein